MSLLVTLKDDIYWFDYCTAEKDILVDYSGILRESLKSALNNLEENDLIESTEDDDMWRVYIKSKDVYFLSMSTFL